MKTEFGFDVLQVARGRYAPDDYREHIGFEVAKALLERAFEETYCLDLNSVLVHYDLAIGSYRRGVSAVIPAITKVAWQIKKDQIQKDIPGMTRKLFLYHLSLASYNKRLEGTLSGTWTGDEVARVLHSADSQSWSVPCPRVSHSNAGHRTPVYGELQRYRHGLRT